MRNNPPKAPKQLSSTNGKSTRAFSQTAEANNLGEIYLDCGPLEADDAEPWRPAIEILKRINRVPSAADLHPSLAFADKPWPSPSFGPVFPGVLEQLRSVRGFLIVKGFNVDADPVNPLGDGKSWALVLELTDSLPPGADPLELARKCQGQIVGGAADPVRNGQTILVPLWDRGVEVNIQSLGPQTAASGSEQQARKRSPRAMRRDAIMFLAISRDLTGIHYCRFLQRYEVGPPADWVSAGCRQTYPEAYEAGQPWQKKIHDEKHRAIVKMQRVRQKDPKQLELLLGKYQ